MPVILMPVILRSSSVETARPIVDQMRSSLDRSLGEEACLEASGAGAGAAGAPVLMVVVLSAEHEAARMLAGGPPTSGAIFDDAALMTPLKEPDLLGLGGEVAGNADGRRSSPAKVVASESPCLLFSLRLLTEK